jgi:hypothetical protein
MIFDRSLKDQTSILTYNPLIHKSGLIALERLLNRGYFQNNRQMLVSPWFPSNSRLFRVICSMNNLEILNFLHWKLTLTEDVPQLFRSCPNLTELRSRLFESQELEMNEELKNELRPGFQRLRLLDLNWEIDSRPVLQEILT